MLEFLESWEKFWKTARWILLVSLPVWTVLFFYDIKRAFAGLQRLFKVIQRFWREARRLPLPQKVRRDNPHGANQQQHA